VLFEEIAAHLHVIVEEEDQLSARGQHAGVTRRRRAGVFLPEEPERVGRAETVRSAAGAEPSSTTHTSYRVTGTVCSASWRSSLRNKAGRFQVR